MRYKPERALTLYMKEFLASFDILVEMRYKPERALTLPADSKNSCGDGKSRNEV